MNPLHIVGGGLAGLSLGRALAAAGVPVTVHERGTYPRHKVCGEFITGLGGEIRQRLGLDPFLPLGAQLRSTAWFYRERPLFTRTLPTPALGLSRWVLDQRLADALVEAGGELRCGEAVRDSAAARPGWLQAGGVRRQRARAADWVGLKVHARGLPLRADLEMHLGRRAYAGLSPVEGGRTNLCMLVHRQACAPGHLRRIEDTLKAVGLGHLSARLETADLDESSRTAVAGVSFARSDPPAGGFALGDASGMIPPFTGHGMAMAFESAALALPWALGYARETFSWEHAAAGFQRERRQRQRTRLRCAALLHPFLLHPPLQRLLAPLSQSSFFPWQLAYRLTHS